MELLEKIQKELKAPKNQWNDFGKYNYRSLEDILEAVKPLLLHEGTLTLSDEVVEVGGRVYVKATATLTENMPIEDNGIPESVSNTAYAREAETKKGMDDAQITGSASSYARKYALNGLFLIDDVKDADTNEAAEQAKNKPEPPKEEEKKKVTWIKQENIDKFFEMLKTGEMKVEDANDMMKQVRQHYGVSKDFEKEMRETYAKMEAENVFN